MTNHHRHNGTIDNTAREAVVAERKAQWICTPQVLRSRPGGYVTHSTELLTDYHHISILKLSVHW